ncbi:MAG: hypothetical protein A3H97_04390 [Acidobacteria bacterium RIFCSPLOWO2_02_FULL_65_29]|nr:MAG: hypothetical protein A3H97_04390 [Acidobacteria bacterium RIFCSPLOWO2_02_FULL_65_29]
MSQIDVVDRSHQPPAGGAAGVAPTDAPTPADFTDEDRRIVSYSEQTLKDGTELARWLEDKRDPEDFQDHFTAVEEFESGGGNFSFFDTVTVSGRAVPVMGIVQDMFYDRQKQADADGILPQVREFILRYFLRVSNARQPSPAADAESESGSPYLRPFDWRPSTGESRIGFGFEQLYYKLRGGPVGKFALEDRAAIVDLRELGRVYDWIVLKVEIFNFNLSYAPLGSGAPKMVYPLKEQTYLLLGPQFVRNREKPEPGVLGEYGYGYAFMPYAPGGPDEMIQYGPGHFAAAFQSVYFKVETSGAITVRASFVVNRPDKVARVDIDPVGWSFQLADLMTFNLASRVMAPVKDAAGRLPIRLTGVDPVGAYISFANFMSGGRAARNLGHSMSVLEKRMLVQHFMQHYEMLNTSLVAWRKIADWTDERTVPAQLTRGVRR